MLKANASIFAWVLSVFVAGSLFGPAARGVEDLSGSLLNGLPRQTTLLLRLRSSSDVVGKFKQSPFYELKDDPSMQGALEELTRNFDQVRAEAREMFGFDPKELLEQFQGEVVFAVGGLDRIVATLLTHLGGAGAGPQVDPGEIPVLLAGDAGGAIEKVSGYLGQVVAFLEKQGGRAEKEDFRGGTITTVVNTGAGQDQLNQLKQIFFAQKESRFFVSINRPFLESTIAGLSGFSGSSLAGHADFSASHRELGEAPDLLLYLDVRGVADAVREGLQANPLQGMIWNLIERKLIGTGLKNFASGLRLETNGVRSANFFNTGGTRDGLLGLLDGSAFSAESAAREVPSSVETLNATAFNFQKFYELLRELANMAMGMFQGGGPGADVEQLLETQFQIKIRDIVGSLGDRLYYYSQPGATPADATGAAAALGNVVVGIELNSPDPLQNFLSNQLPMLAQAFPAAGSLQAEDYRGKKLYRLDEAGPGLAVVGKSLIFAARLDALKDAIGRAESDGGKSLADTEDFRAQTRSVPDSVLAVSFMREGYMKNSLDPVRAVLAEEISFDPQSLFDRFGAGAGYSLWKPSGLYSYSWLDFNRPEKETK